MQTKTWLNAYVAFFETLHKEVGIEAYRAFFSPKSTFEDPFHALQGEENIYGVFQSMYRQLYNPRFEVLEALAGEGGVCYLQWRLTYKRHKEAAPEAFVGVSRVVFSQEGKVASHVDYWDGARNVYEKVPVLGAVLRFVKRRINASA